MCQLCGLPLLTPRSLLADNDLQPIIRQSRVHESYDAWHNRPELSALGSSVRIHDEKVRIARAEFLPSVALTGGYFASYPSVFNSFEKKFKGTWNIGVLSTSLS